MRCELLERRDLLSAVAFDLTLYDAAGRELARTDAGEYKLLPGAVVEARVSVAGPAGDAVFAAWADLGQSLPGLIAWDAASLTAGEDFPLGFGTPAVAGGTIDEAGGYADLVLAEPAAAGVLFTVRGQVATGLPTATRAGLTLDAADEPGHEPLLLSGDAAEAQYETEPVIVAPRWQNPHQAGDVTGDGHITPADELAAWRALRAADHGQDPATVAPWWDVSGDGRATSLDTIAAHLAVLAQQDARTRPGRPSLYAAIVDRIVDDWAA